MGRNETLSGVQRLQESLRTGPCRPARRDKTPGSRIPEAVESQPPETRSEDEVCQAARFPRPCLLERNGILGRSFVLLFREFVVGKPLADDLRKRQLEAVVVVQVLAVVKPKGLFVNIPEQVVRFRASVGSVDTALEEAPEVLKAVRVNVPFDVRH